MDTWIFHTWDFYLFKLSFSNEETFYLTLYQWILFFTNVHTPNFKLMIRSQNKENYKKFYELKYSKFGFWILKKFAFIYSLLKIGLKSKKSVKMTKLIFQKNRNLDNQ